MERKALRNLFLLGVAVTAWGQGRFFPATPGDPVVANQFLIRVNPGTPISNVLLRYLPPGSKSQALSNLNLHVITVPPGIPINMLTALAADAGVTFVEPNRKRSLHVVAPNDPSFSTQWALQTLKAAQAWSLLPDRFLTSTSAGTNRIKIAVLDTGADCTHPDFKNTNATSTDSASGGQFLFSASAALVATSIQGAACPWQDDHGHGTHVAGIIAAAANNGVGVAGLAYPVQLVVYKVLDSQGSGSDATIATAIMNAADAGVQVISLSLGGGGYSQTLQSAIEYAWQRNVLVVCAAGNAGTNSLTFPAGALHAIGVAATDSSNNTASFSNYGDYVELAAPGVGIYSTSTTYTTPFGGGGYATLSGTSMATPFVSALGGMLAMSTPGVSAAAVAQRLQQTALSTVVNGGWNAHVGYGIINAYTAIAGVNRTSTMGAVRGQITTSSGNPLQANVTLNGQTFASDGVSGMFRFPNVPAGTYPVQISATGYPTQNLTVTVASGADTIFAAAMGVSYGSFTGTVTDAGVAVPNVVVQALSANLVQATAVADSSGRYTLWVPAGTYTLNSSTLFGAGIASSATVSASGTTTVNLSFQRFGRITGRVTRNGQPVANAAVDFTGPSGSAGAVTDASGYYTSTGLMAGTYTTKAADSISAATVTNSSVSLDADTTVNIELATSAVQASATFVKLDTTTQGNWKSAYGTEGYTIVGDNTINPAYVTPLPSGQSLWTWAASTADLRALQKASNPTDRIAATWYALPQFTIDLNFTDLALHQIALYCVDWDTTARVQTVDVLDTNNTVLNSQTISSFNNGVYLVWKVSGHVKLRITSLAGWNGLVEGLFFGGAPSLPPSPTASFVKLDTTTQGSWKSAYGTEGYTIVGDNTINPAYVTPLPSGQSLWTWASSTTDIRALQKASNPTDRIASTWYSSPQFTIDLNFTDLALHQIALYCVDWDTTARVQTVDVLDTNNTVLNSQTISSFNNGVYLVWKVSGHVKLRITSLAGWNGLVEGLFFGGASSLPPSPTASFVKLDTTTQGNWKSAYGTEGYTIVGDKTINPAYVTPVPSGQSLWTWAASTTDLRALQKASNPTDRIAATWYALPQFTIDLNFTDLALHQIALYCVDWDTTARVQTVDVLDTNNTVLNSQTISSFNNGVYLVWKVSGHVKLRITSLAGWNGLVEGLFFQ